jgi:Mrp family chromosome partitioning ATPase
LVERSGQSNTPESQLTVVETAEPNFSPTSPNKPMILVFGATAAVLLLGGFILLVELMQNHVKTEDDLRELTQAQVLGGFMLGRRHNQTDPFLASDGRGHPAPEAYQIASLKLLATPRDAAPGATILICAPTSTAATAEVAAYLAAACAQAGHATLLVDADPARRDLSRFFRCEREPGFVDLVNESEARFGGPHRDIAEFSVPLRDAVAVAGLHVLPAGTLPAGATLPAEQLRATIEALRQLPAISLIAGPPITSSAEALVLAQQADTVLLLGVGDQTKSVDVREAVENLALVRDGQFWTALVTTSLLGRLARLARFRGAGAAVTPSTLALEAARPQASLAPATGA